MATETIRAGQLILDSTTPPPDRGFYKIDDFTTGHVGKLVINDPTTNAASTVVTATSSAQGGVIVSSSGPEMWLPDAMGVTNAAALIPWVNALADAPYALTRINYAGDSTVFGYYSDASLTTSDAAQGPLSAPAQLSRIINTMLGTSAPYELSGNDGRVTNSGGAVVPSAGLMGKAYGLGNGNSQTYTLPACTAIQIVYYESNASVVEGATDVTTGSATYSIDGGTAVAITYAAAASTYKTVDITGLSDSAHTITITGTTNNQFWVCQVVGHKGAGIVVSRAGRSGWTTADALGQGTNNSVSAGGKVRLRRAFAMGAPALGILQMGYNDCTLQATAGQLTTPDVYKANVSEIAARYAAANCPLLLVSQQEGAQSDTALAYKYRDYWAAARSLAAPGSNIAHISIADYWGDFSAAKAAGYCDDTGGVHPVRKGYGSIARILSAALTSADLYRKQLVTGA